MKKNSVGAAAAVAVLCGMQVFADVGEEVRVVESGENSPSVSAGAFYRTMKIERGMVENDESVFGYEAELEWFGFFCGLDACYDMTDINGRRGRYNEIESSVGYGLEIGEFKAKAAYVYKAVGEEEEPDTQEVHVELEYETPWVTPFVEVECDVYEKPGAFYGVVGLEREFEFTDWLSLALEAGAGFGNPYRNDADLEAERWAFRDVHLGAALEIEVCPHVKLVPTVDFLDYFTDVQRRDYDKFNGFVCAAVCRLCVEF